MSRIAGPVGIGVFMNTSPAGDGSIIILFFLYKPEICTKQKLSHTKQIKMFDKERVTSKQKMIKTGERTNLFSSLLFVVESSCSNAFLKSFPWNS